MCACVFHIWPQTDKRGMRKAERRLETSQLFQSTPGKKTCLLKRSVSYVAWSFVWVFHGWQAEYLLASLSARLWTSSQAHGPRGTTLMSGPGDVRAEQQPLLATLPPGNRVARSGSLEFLEFWFILNHFDLASLKNSSTLGRKRREGTK